MADKKEKLKGVQRIIARRMSKSKDVIPHVTTIREVRMDKVVQKRKQLNDKLDIHVTFMSFIIKAVIKGLMEYPVLNASLKDKEIIYKEDMNIGIAVAVDDKLLVPVIRKVQTKNFLDLVQAVEKITEKTRDNRLKSEDFKGGTFTISNSGALGGEIFTPIINHPQSAILGIGRIKEKPIVDDEGEIRACPLMYLCLSYDHRIVNGGEAVKFLGDVDEYLQNPIVE